MYKSEKPSLKLINSRENQTLPVIMNVTRVHLYIHVILKGMYNIQYIDLYM